jgi:polyhydroxyalkanoate synthesis regulator phasin
VADESEKRRGPVRPEVVRAAVDQAFQAGVGQARGTTERAQELVDELAQAAGRVREVLDELRPPTADEVRSLRAAVADLERRVAALERDRR